MVTALIVRPREGTVRILDLPEVLPQVLFYPDGRRHQASYWLGPTTPTAERFLLDVYQRTTRGQEPVIYEFSHQIEG